MGLDFTTPSGNLETPAEMDGFTPYNDVGIILRRGFPARFLQRRYRRAPACDLHRTTRLSC